MDTRSAVISVSGNEPVEAEKKFKTELTVPEKIYALKEESMQDHTLRIFKVSTLF